MPFSRYAENKILDETLGRTNTLDFGSVYLGLSTTTPTESGNTISNITEPSGNGYARKLIGQYNQALATYFSAASNGSITNDKNIMFEMATGSWGTCTHAILYDASGNVLAWAALTSSISPVANSVPVIVAGGATFSFTHS